MPTKTRKSFLPSRTLKMPTITVQAGSYQLHLTALNNETWGNLLERASAACQTATGLPWQPASASYSNSEQLLATWHGDCLIGCQDVTVVMEMAPLSDLVASLGRQITDLRKSVNMLAGPHIIDIAARVLMHAVGEKFHVRGTDGKHEDVCLCNTAGIFELTSLTGKLREDIKDGVEAVMKRYNNLHHFDSSCSLVTEVAKCAKLIAMDPSLRETHTWESWVIENFHNFRRAFPDNLN